MSNIIKKIKISGTIFYYYFICKRKLWYYSKYIEMEKDNTLVQIGKLIDKTTYKQRRKHIQINNEISVDFIEGYNVLHEVKKSRKIEKASIWQLKYYIYYLRENGVDINKGILDYPKLRKRKEVVLDNDDKEYIKNVINDIYSIIQNNKIPERINSKICKKCAYYEFCFL